MSAPAKVTHVLLDLDGTLSDSEPGILRSLQWACEIEGFPIPNEAQVRSVIGPPFEIGLPSIGIPDDALFRVIKTYRERYETIGLFENTLYDGIVSMLDALAAAGLSLSIATAKPERTAVRIIDHFGLTERFEFIVGATLTQERRAKHQIITHVLGLLGLEGGETGTPRVIPSVMPRVIMVGDRDHDVHGALQNGLPCVGVTWGYGSVEELLTAGAFALADEPADVVDLVLAPYRSDERP
ncbi:MAG TPA: HAD hydrolase-like protein [Ilumatobacteraceae bacterium]|nr:HAD hydrolase-like protein [Ilumatobacteraceae bacterium]